MAVTHALLGLLARGERHGYQLRQELEAELGPEWRIDFGHLYRLLAAMRRRGWVGMRSAPGAKGPRRKLYARTAAGDAELRRWLNQPGAVVRRGRDELAIKLHFGGSARRGQTERLLAERRRVLESQRHAHRQLYDQTPVSDARHRVVAETRLRQTEGALSALAACGARGLGPTPDGPLVAMGSDDLVLDLLSRTLAEGRPAPPLRTERVGSLDGLMALRDGRAHLAGIHLLDVESGEYNVPFVKHLLLEDPVVLVHIAQREQGLMVAPGNPKAVRRLTDLTRRDVRLVNRQRGAGTRLFLFHRLRAARIDPQRIVGFERTVPTHAAVAAAITAGTADVGPGIRAVAEQHGLDFIALGHERYDLVIPRALFDSRRLRPLLEALHARPFRRAAAALTGYDVSRMSAIVASLH